MNTTNRIRELRLKNGLTQAQLAKEVGVTRASVYKWETLGAIPRFQLFPLLKKALACSTDDLLSKELRSYKDE